ncbi:hypothetical protein CHS0354_012243 [Potamilus streckersoni]|uniref:Amine oxidase domain-containing protein n=1 Tax=Potamilus streckersoni TaxID=2493646 RepID=A0AAE0VSA0_9BIVA|nr:hypothetical protein CHS0354_012243 [Potamilus streckersoni]
MEKMDLNPKLKKSQPPLIQQEDNDVDFYNNILTDGLQYEYAIKSGEIDPDRYKRTKTKYPKNVIIIGAGMSGLVAAYELEQVGHQTTVIELSGRVGGRVKTIHDFSNGLHAEGGAMRLPPNQFLTKHYIDLFQIPTRPFKNKNEKGLLHLYGKTITLKEWEENNKEWTNFFWPGWDENLTPEDKEEAGIEGILDLYEKTIEPVKNEILEDHSKEGWKKWVAKWSKMSMLDFFRSEQYQDSPGPKLRPWTEQAILAYKVSGYRPILEISMVEYLRDELGGWWLDNLYTPTNGMSDLPEHFILPNKYGWNKDVNLLNRIHFGIRVESVEVDKDTHKVIVKGSNSTTGKEVSILPGDAVIITLPVTILRQLKLPLTTDQQKALVDITYEPSTKVLMQFRERFWQDQVGQGGFTKTDLPIGQIHYPDWDDSELTSKDRGILVSYTWGQDALIFGSQPKDQAVASAIRILKQIHDETDEYFEHGTVQAWFSDPAAQGAFAYLHPYEYNNSMAALQTSHHPIYLAGEAISWANGWIQGALMSGLNAAFDFYSHNEQDSRN